MNTQILRFFRQSFFVFSFLLFSWMAQAASNVPLIKHSRSITSDEKRFIKIVDISEGPSLFVVAGMSYVDQKAVCELSIEAFNSGHLDFTLSTMKGEILFLEHKRIQPGLNHLGLSLTNYPCGIYQLDMKLESEKKTLIIEKVAGGLIKARMASPIE